MTIKSRLQDAIFDIQLAIDDLPEQDWEEESTEYEEINDKALLKINSDLLQIEAQQALGFLDDKSYELLKYHLQTYKKTLTI